MDKRDLPREREQTGLNGVAIEEHLGSVEAVGLALPPVTPVLLLLLTRRGDSFGSGLFSYLFPKIYQKFPFPPSPEFLTTFQLFQQTSYKRVVYFRNCNIMSETVNSYIFHVTSNIWKPLPFVS